MIATDKLEAAVAEYDVTLSNEECGQLGRLITRVETIYARHIADQSIDDIVGPAGSARSELGTIAAGAVLASCVAAAKGNFNAPDLIGSIDPFDDAIEERIIIPADARYDHAMRVADATRRVAALVGSALSQASPADLELLAAAKFAKAKAGRPSTGLGLATRIILAVYFFWSRLERDLALSLGNPRRGRPPSELVRVTLATLQASGLYADATTVRYVLNPYRRNVLRAETAAKGFFDDVKPSVKHFTGRLVDTTDPSPE